MRKKASLPHTQLVQIALVALLLIGCITVLSPFVATLMFAIVICVTTAPIFRVVLRWLRGKKTPTALLFSLVLLCLLVAPMALLSGILADGINTLSQHIRPLLENGLPSHLPEWVANMPLIGQSIEEYWVRLIDSREEMNGFLRQFLAPTRQFAIAIISIFGQGMLQLMLVIFFVFFIFRDLDSYGETLRAAAHKLAGELGERMLKLAGGTITGVMVGIVGTAAAQALVAMFGFLLAGVPGVLLLTFATFFFSMVPVIGATLIWLGAAFWLYNDGQTGWAIFQIVWGIFAISSVDNFIKPILISRTSSLPLLLIIIGVFGGVLMFGFIGLFLGPTFLALGQVMIREWLQRKDDAEDISETAHKAAHD